VKLPNADRAIVDIRKLRDYVLNTEHQRGRHKARVFASAFGMTADDAKSFQDYLLEAAKQQEVAQVIQGDYGTVYRMDTKLTWNEKTNDIRVTWIVRKDEDFPRLVSCYVKRKGKRE